MNKIKIVGLGINKDLLFSQYKTIISNADVLIGGERFLNLFPYTKAEKIPIKSPIEEIIKKANRESDKGKEVVFIADGDPGFFGIGRRLCEFFGPQRIEIYPNISTLQATAGKIGIPWDDIYTLSLHGRDNFHLLLNALSRKEKVGVFTDPKISPSFIAEKLLKKGVSGFKVYVAEDLGMDSERIQLCSLEDMAKKKFSNLNFLIFIRESEPEVPLRLGIDDEKYVHDKGLITKKEIRSIAISLLDIKPYHVIWDLGAGCGSVGIEAFYLLSTGRVIAVEKDQRRVAQIKENIKKTWAFGVDVILGHMPECLDGLLEPDRIFMGGGIKKEVLKKISLKLKPQGVWILHMVLLRSLNEAVSFFKEINWDFELFQVQINRTTELAGDKMLKPLNPVFIIKTVKS